MCVTLSGRRILAVVATLLLWPRGYPAPVVLWLSRRARGFVRRMGSQMLGVMVTAKVHLDTGDAGELAELLAFVVNGQ